MAPYIIALFVFGAVETVIVFWSPIYPQDKLLYTIASQSKNIQTELHFDNFDQKKHINHMRVDSNQEFEFVNSFPTF